jgi:ribosomal protein S1
MARRGFCSLVTVFKKSNGLSQVIKSTSPVVPSLLKQGQQITAQVLYSMDDIGFIVSIENHPIQGLIPITEHKYIQQMSGRAIKYGDTIKCYVGKVSSIFSFIV